MGHVCGVEHGDEDEGLDGGHVGAERGLLLDGESPVEFRATSIAAREPAVDHEDGAVDDAGDAKHAAFGIARWGRVSIFSKRMIRQEMENSPRFREIPRIVFGKQ